MDSFEGFSRKSLTFLRGLENNNNREWFDAHRDEYHRYVAGPMKRLSAAILPMLRELDPGIDPRAYRHISRLNRDVRFSNDKSPYWTSPWMAFRHPLKEWYRAPTFFFEFHGTGFSYGMNMYAPLSATMKQFRDSIDAEPQRFRDTVAFLQKNRTIKIENTQYKRRFPCSHDKSIELWYQSRDIEIVARSEKCDLLFSPKLPDTMLFRFLQLKPLYDYLWSITFVK